MEMKLFSGSRWIFYSIVVTVTAVLSCRQSEFQCFNGDCISLNKVCNGIDDCGDKSDEQQQCSPCNKTYYGEINKTYELELHRPKEDKVPYICKLTFSAPGGNLGDIVQLTFDSFTLGKFVSFTTEGCPDGSLQITEANRPDVGGHWCGTSWGPAIYYSETSTVSITLRLFRLSKDQTGYNFDFRMTYKMIRHSDALVRYKNPFVGVINSTLAIIRNINNLNKITVEPEQPIQFNTSTNVKSMHVTTIKSITKVVYTNEIVSPTMEISPTVQTELIRLKFNSEQHLGELISGTYCSKTFSDCDKKTCRLQSPNFPGFYPRNLTCYYAIRQHEVPDGKHPLISVSQSRGQLIAVRSKPSTQAQLPPRELQLWDDCDIVKDYVTIYDGYNTMEPVILKFCGGGEPLPEIISSGKDLLVVFTTSPYGTFPHPSPLYALHGFQLDVQVKFVDSNSTTYAKNKRCEFWIHGSTGGILTSPRHSLPRNSTCLYHLRGENPNFPSPTSPRPIPKFPTKADIKWGRQKANIAQPQFRVWLSILKFHVGISPTNTDDECSTTLKIWDGEMMPLLTAECNDVFCGKHNASRDNMNNINKILPDNRLASNTSLLGRYCKDKVPRSCDHAVLKNASRPCSFDESFVSSGNSLTIEIIIPETTALRPLDFLALYEFIDLYQDGDAYGNSPCSRIFYSRNRHTYPDFNFRAPKDIFLFGRGGAKNLTCVYRFEGEQDEQVKLKFNKIFNGNRSCQSTFNLDFNRLICVGSTEFSIKIMELPWRDAPSIQRDCLCSNLSLPIKFKSKSNIVEVHFNVHSMNALDDYNNLYFEGTWEFSKSIQCMENRRVHGPSGEIKNRLLKKNENEEYCESFPWLIEPALNQYLYVKVQGVIATNRTKCDTKNRIVVHTAGKLYAAVCPKPIAEWHHNFVEIFSDGWTVNDNSIIVATADNDIKSIVVEYIIKEIITYDEEYSITWLELRRRPLLTSSMMNFRLGHDCEQRCPELDACINSSLWCDGVNHCPTGYDEALSHCSILLRLPPLHLGLGAIVIISVGGFLCFVSWCACQHGQGTRSISQHRLKSISSETAIIDGKEIIC